MTNYWPWLAVAGVGTLHGLNPANGWMFAAACGVRSRDTAQARRALLPIGVGHVASVAIVAGAFAQGLAMDRALVQRLAGALLVGAAVYRWVRGESKRAPINAQAGQAAIALWSFLMATAHGAGLMLVPALASMCLAGNPARDITASGSLVLALAAVGVHMSAMLLATGIVASGVCRGFALQSRLPGGTTIRRAWTAMLAVTGVLLMMLL
jgi:hypothetical protein